MDVPYYERTIFTFTPAPGQSPAGYIRFPDALAPALVGDNLPEIDLGGGRRGHVGCGRAMDLARAGHGGMALVAAESAGDRAPADVPA